MIVINFEQRLTRSKDKLVHKTPTGSCNRGVKSYTDVVHELVPELLDTQTEELSQTDFASFQSTLTIGASAVIKIFDVKYGNS